MGRWAPKALVAIWALSTSALSGQSTPTSMPSSPGDATAWRAGADLNALWTSRARRSGGGLSDLHGLVPVFPDAGSEVRWQHRHAGRPTSGSGINRWSSTGCVIGTDNPDLTAFRDRGGKAIVWHGWADQLITAEGTIDYYTRVQQQMGGAKKTSEFIRLFMAPGVAHCAGGAGPQPTGQLEALLAWVEDGKAPETLPADAPRSDRRRHAVAAGVRVSARREVQGQRQHGRRGQLHRAAPGSRRKRGGSSRHRSESSAPVRQDCCSAICCI